MSDFQKVIKYCAIGFAVLLIIIIVSGIANTVFAIGHFTTGGFNWRNNSNEDTIDFTETFTGVESLDIDNATGELKIKIGDEFKVEAFNVSESFEAKVTPSGTLKISEDRDGADFFWFHFDGFNNPNSKVTLYIPENFIADEVKIDTGAGSVTIDKLSTDNLTVSAGAGNISGNDMIADEVKIDGGVGNVNLSDVNFKDADLNCGVGNLNIDGVLQGDNKIDCGVGEVELDLTGDINEYDLDIDSGVGTIRVNGEKVNESEYNNNDAKHTIKIDGGVGNVKINIEK